VCQPGLQIPPAKGSGLLQTAGRSDQPFALCVVQSTHGDNSLIWLQRKRAPGLLRKLAMRGRLIASRIPCDRSFPGIRGVVRSHGQKASG
jgi:hypothetical protein